MHNVQKANRFEEIPKTLKNSTKKGFASASSLAVPAHSFENFKARSFISFQLKAILWLFFYLFISKTCFKTTYILAQNKTTCLIFQQLVLKNSHVHTFAVFLQIPFYFMLTAENISKTYPHPTLPVVALQSVSLQVGKGEFVALVGASGSGKSTLLKILGGLLQPTTGKVSIAGECLTNLNDNQLTRFRRKAIGFIFQDLNLMPVLTAIENIVFGLRLQGRKHKEATQLAYQWLEKVGLMDKAHVRPASLSGGQQQRVAVARAMAMQPQLLIADEPTSSLDSQNALQIAELLQNLQQTTQTTLILATHDARLLPFAGKIIEIQDGQLCTK